MSLTRAMRLRTWLLLACISSLLSAFAAPVRTGVNLQEVRVTKRYRDTLSQAFDRLTMWCVVHSKPMPDDLKGDADEMANLLIDHVQFLFDSQKGVSAGRAAILAVQHRFRLHSSVLIGAWDSVKAWEGREPVRMRIPLPPLILEAMFVHAMFTGFESIGDESREWICFAIGLIVSFCSFLRPCEWTALAAGRVGVPSGRLQGLVNKAILTIMNAKNRRLFGRIQVAVCEDVRAIDWLTWLIHALPGTARLAPGGTPRFRKYFDRCVRALGIAHLGLTPASLRAGGATHSFNRGLDLGHIKFRGRWASLRTLEHYLQEATGVLVMLRLDDHLLTRLENIAAFSSKFSEPPVLSWSAFFSRSRQFALLDGLAQARERARARRAASLRRKRL